MKKLINWFENWFERNVFGILAFELYMIGMLLNLITSDNPIQMIILFVTPFIFITGYFLQLVHRKKVKE